MFELIDHCLDVFFFFQAEDGIRDWSVTGVQTCALPISWCGFGVWSLVAQQMTSSLVRATVLWRLSPWRPKWLFSGGSLREMFTFGSGMLEIGRASCRERV